MKIIQCRLWIYFAIALAPLSQADSGSSIKVQEGFTAIQYAGPELADDIYSMTLDSKGRVVVSGRGYIRTLHDTNQDGIADKSVQFTTLDRGTMGMLFEGQYLWAVANRALLRYVDSDNDGKADGPPRQFLRLANGEHGAHAIRKGPDGWLYLIGGNDTGFTSKQFNSLNSPLKKTEGGAIIRFSTDGKIFEALSCGFRNPYDFDFNWRGDIFTYDSDTERTFFLPWYTPTRLYHVAIGGHHGWRMPGFKRSWARPSYYSDTVPDIHKIGRGSPTGVVVYSHSLFPKKMQDGIFILDWTFGNIWFYPLKDKDASYQAPPQLFISPIGTDGFAPSDIEVGRNGELFISTGGRGTKGSVLRVIPTKDNSNKTNKRKIAKKKSIKTLLNAPQPMTEWSRSQWEPIAKQVGAAHLTEAALNTNLKPRQRVRAIEILTDIFGGLDSNSSEQLSKSSSPNIRARTAWTIGRYPSENTTQLLNRLALDKKEYVRVKALESMLRLLPEDPSQSGEWIDALYENFNQSSIRVRLISARLSSRLPKSILQKSDYNKLTTQGKVTAITGDIWRNSEKEIHIQAIQRLLPLINSNQAANLNLDIVRTIILALGDYNLERPSRESFTGYETPYSLTPLTSLTKTIAIQVMPLMDTLHQDLKREASRLLAMVSAEQPKLIKDLLYEITPETNPVEDFHKLIVMAKLPSTLLAGHLPKLANALMQLDIKLKSQGTRPKLNWTMRFADIAQAHASKQPGLIKKIIDHENFPSASHLEFARMLKGENRLTAAKRYLEAIRINQKFPWSNELIDLIEINPEEELLSVLRQQWSNHGLRLSILKRLAKQPKEQDRKLFLEAILSRDNSISKTALAALQKLPPSNKPSELAFLIRKFRRECGPKGKADTRKKTLALLTNWSGTQFDRAAAKNNLTVNLLEDWQPVFDWFNTTYPAHEKKASDSGLVNATKWDSILGMVNWNEGKLNKGKKIFVNRACQNCHSGAGALGPDLAGAAKRLSPEDLFRTIIFPNRDISPLYKFNEYRMHNGDVHVGRTAFYAADGIVLRTGSGIIRLDQKDIASKKTSELSIMPEGLLEGLKASELADLYQFLKSL